MNDSTNGTGYATAFSVYFNLGWPSMLPLPTREKRLILSGYTGHTGEIPSYPDMQAWADDPKHRAGNLCLRLPPDVIGIDVDNYDGKNGAATLAEYESRCGNLPYSPRSSSRPDDPHSGIRLYRIPPGEKLSQGGGGVDIIQNHHRYVLCWPSIHPEGRQYNWYGIDGGKLDSPPALADIPALPPEWLTALRETGPEGAESAAGDPVDVRKCLTEGKPSPRVYRKLGKALSDVFGDHRHDDICTDVLGLLRVGKNGEPGVKTALQALGEAFVNHVGKSRPGGETEAREEFRNYTYRKVGGKWVFRDEVARKLADPNFDDDNDQSTESKDSSDATDSDYEQKLSKRLEALRLDADARQRFKDETRPAVILPPVKNLTTLLAEPDTPTPYRINKVAPEGSRIMLSAQFKGGKTTLVENLQRALVDGGPFLGAFDVTTPARVVLIDTELSENMLRRWLRDQRIENTAAIVDAISLRGRVGTLNLLDDHTRGIWAQRLRDCGCDYLILDCLRPVLDALGLDENHDAGRFLTPFDALMAEAEISDALIVHHMGHVGERARGDSRLQDWPDAIWRVVRENEEPDSPRYFSAYGRDVDVSEGLLSFDPVTRHLTYAAGSRADVKTEAAMLDIVKILAKDAKENNNTGCSGHSLEMQCDHTQKAVRDGIKEAVKRGIIKVERGAHGANLHRIAYPCEECGHPVITQGARHLSCPDRSDE